MILSHLSGFADELKLEHQLAAARDHALLSCLQAVRRFRLKGLSK